MNITPGQCKAARALLEMTQAELSDESGVSALTISYFETGKRNPTHGTLSLLSHAFKRVGVEFIDANGGGPGVRLKAI